MLYIEPKEHKRIILTDTHSGNCTIIALEYHRGHLSLGFSAPDAVKIKHLVSDKMTREENNLKSNPYKQEINPQYKNKEQCDNGKEQNTQRTN